MHVDETLTDLWILVCELHKNAFGERAVPRTAGGSKAHPRILSHYKWEEREGRGRKGLVIVGRGGREGRT